MSALRRAHSWNTVLFVVFLLAIVFVYTGIWQLAFAAGYVGGLFGKRGRRDFALGFLGVAFAWGGHLVWMYVFAQGAAVASLLAEILGLSAGAGVVVPVLALLIGGITGGLGALLGAYAGQLALPRAPVTEGEPGPERADE